MPKPDAHHGETVVKRVSAKGHDEAHGGAWKVAFADFCLALLCLFLVLWLLASRDKEAAEQNLLSVMGTPIDEGSQGHIPDLKGSQFGSLITREPVPGQGGTNAARGPNQGNGQTDQAHPLQRKHMDGPEDMQLLARKLSGLAEDAGLESHLKTEVTPQGLRVLLHDTDGEGMFARGSAVPNTRFRKLLTQMGPLFAEIDNQLLVLGHTDATAYANTDAAAFSNWTLSNQRAMAARLSLTYGGMPAASVLQVIGMADRAPMKIEDPRAAVNRRIELVVLSTAQARALAAAFGMPGQVQPLAEGADMVVSQAAPSANGAAAISKMGLHPTRLPAAEALPLKATVAENAKVRHQLTQQASTLAER
ncbi:OmpA family protein [Ideonella azotifigens]|uniref:Flagellar motor protein MotB n=1 Tax=Ideonella azotifigens TaxID=513160 RepID=A0ABP3VJ13_9BURK|nr:flagellar motor protein MotB [Ideonella azotifigens]MCD2339104.1 OmpA family protein [Ideonella azotifigens]